MKRYIKELKNEIIQLHLKEGITIKSLSKEYHLGSGTLQYWLKELRKECQNNPYIEEVALSFEEPKKLIKENEFLKKSSGILCKGNRISEYQFIQHHGEEFGIRWLCRKFQMSTNAYFNYLKQRKAAYYEKKAEVQRFISISFHQSKGTMGAKMMRDYCDNQGYQYSLSIIRKYMREMNLASSIRRKKQTYKSKKQHLVFPNLVQQHFIASKPNRVWCVDFAYLYLANGTPRYNCTILDVYDRRIVSSKNGNHINTQLLITTLQEAIHRYYPEVGLILHSDQGSQFSSNTFTEFCKKRLIQQSMSRAGCPYDNAVMERYFNTLKHECTNHYSFTTKERMDSTIFDFEENWYNSKRPHTFNNGKPPYQVYANSSLL